MDAAEIVKLAGVLVLGLALGTMFRLEGGNFARGFRRGYWARWREDRASRVRYMDQITIDDGEAFLGVVRFGGHDSFAVKVMAEDREEADLIGASIYPRIEIQGKLDPTDKECLYADAMTAEFGEGTTVL